MSLRSPLTQLSVSPSPNRPASRFSWATLAAIVGVMTVSATGCGGCDDNTVQCDPGGMNCVICDAYGCRSATTDTVSGAGGGGMGGAATNPAITGTGGSATATHTTGHGGGTSTMSTTGSGGAGGSTTGLSCNSMMPCPTPQVCETDGFCHYPCNTVTDCKLYDNRFVACVGGVCKTQQELGDGGM
jgi:hypothetical protein